MWLLLAFLSAALLGFYDAFGDSYEEILQEMNEELVA